MQYGRVQWKRKCAMEMKAYNGRFIYGCNGNGIVPWKSAIEVTRTKFNEVLMKLE